MSDTAAALDILRHTAMSGCDDPVPSRVAAPSPPHPELVLPMSRDLSVPYRSYVDCLNRRAWDELGAFVRDDVVHNGRTLGLSGYRAMLEDDIRRIPDLRFTVELLACDGATVAARLLFDCTPMGDFLGFAVDGRRVAFAENVFYRFEGGKIRAVWSIIDRAAIEAQLG